MTSDFCCRQDSSERPSVAHVQSLSSITYLYEQAFREEKKTVVVNEENWTLEQEIGKKQSSRKIHECSGQNLRKLD